MNARAPRFSDPRWDLVIGPPALALMPVGALSLPLMLCIAAGAFVALSVRLARADRFRASLAPGDPRWTGVGSKINNLLRQGLVFYVPLWLGFALWARSL